MVALSIKPTAVYAYAQYAPCLEISSNEHCHHYAEQLNTFRVRFLEQRRSKVCYDYEAHSMYGGIVFVQIIQQGKHPSHLRSKERASRTFFLFHSRS